MFMQDAFQPRGCRKPHLCSLEIENVSRLQQLHAFSRRSDTRQDALGARDVIPSNQETSTKYSADVDGHRCPQMGNYLSYAASG